VEIGIVVGGGNFFRGMAEQAKAMDRVSADNMGMLGHAAEEVASTHDDADLHTQRMNVGNFAGNSGDLVGIQAKPTRSGQRFT
jgi:hypothetical protein